MRCMLNRANRSSRRRGNAAVLTAVSCTTLIGFMALSVDVGMIYNTRSELQRTADSAAMAAAWKLLDNDKLACSANMTTEIYGARSEAASTTSSIKRGDCTLTSFCTIGFCPK